MKLCCNEGSIVNMGVSVDVEIFSSIHPADITSTTITNITINPAVVLIFMFFYLFSSL